MRAGLLRLALAAALFAAASPAGAQSVADAARAAQQQKSGQPSRKVYTNDDLGTASSSSDRNAPGGASPKPAAEKPSAKDRTADAKRLSTEILKQEEQVARLQQHYDRLQAIVTERANLETPPNVTPAMCGQEPELCESRREAARDLARTGQQLSAAKAKLTDMQDKARKQGYSTAVWDP